MTNHDELCEKDILFKKGQLLVQQANEIKELRTRVAELEKELEKWKRTAERCFSADDKVGCYIYISDGSVADEFKKLVGIIHSCEQRLSTLLKASEGMEEALEKIHRKAFDDDFKWINVKDVAQSALADFRAVKEVVK